MSHSQVALYTHLKVSILSTYSGRISWHTSKSITGDLLWSRSTPSTTDASGKNRKKYLVISAFSFRNIAMIIKIHWKFIQIQITFLNYGEKISKKKWKKRVRKEKIKNEEPKKKKRNCSRMILECPSAWRSYLFHRRLL